MREPRARSGLGTDSHILTTVGSSKTPFGFSAGGAEPSGLCSWLDKGAIQQIHAERRQESSLSPCPCLLCPRCSLGTDWNLPFLTFLYESCVDFGLIPPLPCASPRRAWGHGRVGAVLLLSPRGCHCSEAALMFLISVTCSDKGG